MKSSWIVLIGLISTPVASAGDLPPLDFTGKPATLPPRVFADGTWGPKLPPSPFADGSWGLKLPRAVLIAKEPPDHLPTRLLAYSPEDEIQEILFLGDDGPIILRTRILVDGRGYRLAWGEFVHRLYRFLDRDDDGYVTVKEANAGNAIQGFLNGNPFQRGVQNSNQGGPKIDEDKDDRVSFPELMAYLAPRAAPFSIQPGLGADARAEALFTHLDKNRDRKLTRAEVDAAGAILRPFDLDEDETFTVAEIGPFQGRFANQRRFINNGNPAGIAALAIHSGEPLAPVVQALINRYDKPSDPANLTTKDAELSRGEFKVDRAGFDAADRNRDGRLNSGELMKFLESARFDLEFTLRVDLKTGRGSIETIKAASGATTSRAVADELVEIDLDTIKVALKAQPSRKNPNGFDARQFFLTAFHGADADGDNVLDKKEQAQAQFINQIVAVADRNGDEKLRESELIAYLDLSDLAGFCRTTLSVSDLGRALFNHLDRDHDQRLGPREVRQAWLVLAGDDRDKDGRVAIKEIPRHFLLAVGRGQANAQFFGFVDDEEDETPVPRADPATAAPTWFHRMDRNRDGDLSPREFLGSSAEFARIDADRDGLISPREAASVK